ncbi:MAG: hypothetical protein ACK2VD_11275 [Anaerolineae bacterium]
MAQPIRVMITDNLAIVSAGLRTLVDDRPNNAGLVGQSDDCREPVWQAHLLRPGVILVNLAASGQGGDRAVDVIQMKDPRVRILVPGELVEDDRAIAAVKAALCMLSRRGNPDHSAALVPKGLSDRETEEPTLPAREPMKVGSRV